jgi:CRP-like cAMP-binding protein
MQTAAFSQLFPLCSTASPETIAGLLSVAVEHEYPANRAVLMEDAWGNAVYLVESGWVRVRRHVGSSVITLAILGQGDFFGEMAILDESPRSTDVVALSKVRLLSISAQHFIQTLLGDSHLHHRMLQLMVRRLRQANYRAQLRHQPAAIKLINTLVTLGEAYGLPSRYGTEIFYVPYQDLADVSDITVDETSKIMEKLESKGWIRVVPDRQAVYLAQMQQLMQVISRI